MTTSQRPYAVGAMYAGLCLTVVALIVLYVGHANADVLAEHVRAGYPAYPEARIDAAVTTYLAYLSVLGALGIAGWLATIRAVKAGKRWSGGLATALFVVGTGLALMNLVIKDTSGDTGLPPLLGWTGMLPCLAGLVTIALLWRRPGTLTRSA
ncbi:hypothetical protein [Saccharomonospora piscinae]|uniref:hypothetical protein n=1 Tax=Saccharomonospora piscinae TaxID=687388 RepID=UPI001AECF184|nr:hypothetical protein [Saccharomonospora piscinae]